MSPFCERGFERVVKELDGGPFRSMDGAEAINEPLLEFLSASLPVNRHRNGQNPFVRLRKLVQPFIQMGPAKTPAGKVQGEHKDPKSGWAIVEEPSVCALTPTGRFRPVSSIGRHSAPRPLRSVPANSGQSCEAKRLTDSPSLADVRRRSDCVGARVSCSIGLRKDRFLLDSCGSGMRAASRSMSPPGRERHVRAPIGLNQAVDEPSGAARPQTLRCNPDLAQNRTT